MFGCIKKMAVATCIVAVCGMSAYAAKIKDIANVVGVRDNQLIGYGLVVGLNGTGDKTTSTFTMQSLANMLESVNVKIDPNDINSKNVAAVMVTAKLPPFARQGDKIDILISSIGDAKSLEGGTLVLTPLSGLDGRIYATAQGALAIGGKNERGGSINHPLAASIFGGGIVEREVDYDLYNRQGATLSLKTSNFQNAINVQDRINAAFPKPQVDVNNTQPIVRSGLNSQDMLDLTQIDIASMPSQLREQEPVAKAVDPRTIRLSKPANMSMIEFLARVQEIDVDHNQDDRVIINERTGTVIAGMNVPVTPIVVTHGGITIKVSNTPINDPNAQDLGDGTSLSLQQGTVSSNQTTVASVTKALQRMGATPKDVISILETMKKAGAFVADLEVI